MAIEYEARFLEIDKDLLIKNLVSFGASDKGQVLLKETIYYDAAGTWQASGKLVRVHTKDSNQTTVTFKHHRTQSIDGALETEFQTNDTSTIEEFLTNIGLVAARRQEKTRHTFSLNETTIDIDTWPNVPAYVEIEGSNEKVIKDTASQLGFDWQDAVFEDVRKILENRYNIPIRSLSYFTFDKIE